MNVEMKFLHLTWSPTHVLKPSIPENQGTDNPQSVKPDHHYNKPTLSLSSPLSRSIVLIEYIHLSANC